MMDDKATLYDVIRCEINVTSPVIEQGRHCRLQTMTDDKATLYDVICCEFNITSPVIVQARHCRLRL